jgi:Flp pilus assembly protein CpaB
MSEDTSTARKTKKKGGASKTGRGVFGIAIASALLGGGGVLGIVGSAAQTTTYYVLGQDVPSRTQITPEMLVPVEASLGGQPRNALDITAIQQANVQGGEGAFSLVPLHAGDVLSPSTVGPLERINADLPAGFVAASFALTPENAVAGKVRQGDYIDVIAVDDSNAAGTTSKVVLHHVLVLDVTSDPQTITQSATSGQEGAELEVGPESSAVRGGIPSLYVVGVSPQDAVRLALVRDKNLLITLSANDSTGGLDAQTQIGSLFTGGEVPDSGAGTEAATAGASEAAPADATSTPTN